MVWDISTEIDQAEAFADVDLDGPIDASRYFHDAYRRAIMSERGRSRENNSNETKGCKVFTLTSETQQVPFCFLNGCIGKNIEIKVMRGGHDYYEESVIVGRLELFKSHAYEDNTRVTFYMKRKGHRKDCSYVIGGDIKAIMIKRKK